MLPGDQLVCAFVEFHELGTQFVAWPLHVTIMPWFRIDVATESVATQLQTQLHDVRSFMITMGAEAHFGRGGRKLVRLVVLPSFLTMLESLIRGFLKAGGAWVVDETTKRRQTFRPHVTIQGDEQLASGDTFTCDRLYIIEQRGNTKVVAGIVRLGV